jgi:signal recognition particle subunit SRP19
LDGKIVIWPANIDSSKSRLQGRKIPKGQAVQTPRIEELVAAARQLSIEIEVSHKKSRPRTWWEKTGYIITAKPKTRTELLRMLTAEIRKSRATKTEEENRKHVKPPT